jgi:hypothetical protein
MSELTMLGFDYPERKNTGVLSGTKAKLVEVESKLDAEKAKNESLQSTLQIVMTGGGAVIFILMVVVFILASTRQVA